MSCPSQTRQHLNLFIGIKFTLPFWIVLKSLIPFAKAFNEPFTLNYSPHLSVTRVRKRSENLRRLPGRSSNRFIHKSHAVAWYDIQEKNNLTKLQSKIGDSAQTSEAQKLTDAMRQVSRISVCSGDLCQCQGEAFEYTGGATDAIVNELQRLGFPFLIDEVGCLGSCGMGTMVLIEYENGNAVMTDGLESTLREFGIDNANSIIQNIDSSNSEIGHLPQILHSHIDITSSEGSKSGHADTKQIALKKTSLPADARERMRIEAASSVGQGNPWVNMTWYLAKKVLQKVTKG